MHFPRFRDDHPYVLIVRGDGFPCGAGSWCRIACGFANHMQKARTLLCNWTLDLALVSEHETDLVRVLFAETLKKVQQIFDRGYMLLRGFLVQTVVIIGGDSPWLCHILGLSTFYEIGSIYSFATWSREKERWVGCEWRRSTRLEAKFLKYRKQGVSCVGAKGCIESPLLLAVRCDPVALRSFAGLCCAVPFGALLCRGASPDSVLCCLFHCSAWVVSCLVRCCAGMLCCVCPWAQCCVVLLCCLWSRCCRSLCRVFAAPLVRCYAGVPASFLTLRCSLAPLALASVVCCCLLCLPVCCWAWLPSVVSWWVLVAPGAVVRWCCPCLPAWLAALCFGVVCLGAPLLCVVFCGAVLSCGGVLSCSAVFLRCCLCLLLVSGHFAAAALCRVILLPVVLCCGLQRGCPCVARGRLPCCVVRGAVGPCSFLVPCSPVLCPVVLCFCVVLWCPVLLPCVVCCLCLFACPYFKNHC